MVAETTDEACVQAGHYMMTMLGLPGFTVCAAVDLSDELEVIVETDAVKAFCRSCGGLARLHDRRPSWVQDLPAGRRPVRLCWLKRVWRCDARALDGSRCAPRTWTERNGAIRPRVVRTERRRRRPGGWGGTRTRWSRSAAISVSAEQR